MIKILELFGGIGAPRKALINLGVEHKAIDYVEIDEKAVRSYNAMYDRLHKPQSVVGWDLRPDILVHGSPCQDYSRSGKRLGGKDEDKTRSSLMWETIRIIEAMGEWRPKVVVWENVKGVLDRDMIHSFNLGDKAFDFGRLRKRPTRHISEFLETDVSDPQYQITIPSMLNRIEEFNPGVRDKYRPLDVIEDSCWTITTRQDRCPNAGIIKQAGGGYSLCNKCNAVEIPEPEYCCNGYECGCYGMPIEPPFCASCEEIERGEGMTEQQPMTAEQMAAIAEVLDAAHTVTPAVPETTMLGIPVSTWLRSLLAEVQRRDEQIGTLKESLEAVIEEGRIESASTATETARLVRFEVQHPFADSLDSYELAKLAATLQRQQEEIERLQSYRDGWKRLCGEVSTLKAEGQRLTDEKEKWFNMASDSAIQCHVKDLDIDKLIGKNDRLTAEVQRQQGEIDQLQQSKRVLQGSHDLLAARATEQEGKIERITKSLTDMYGEYTEMKLEKGRAEYGERREREKNERLTAERDQALLDLSNQINVSEKEGARADRLAEQVEDVAGALEDARAEVQGQQGEIERLKAEKELWSKVAEGKYFAEVDRLQAENDQIRFEVQVTEEHWKGEYDRCQATLLETCSKVNHLESDLADARQQQGEAVDALEWYGDPDIYTDGEDGFHDRSTAEYDGGERAREVLAKMRGDRTDG